MPDVSPSKPTISVKGVGQVRIPPDQTVVTFSVSALAREYAASANQANERVANLRTRLAEVEVPATRLKTTSYSIEREHEWRGVKENRRQEFVGWRSRQHMRLELPIDRDFLNKVFGAIASNDIESSIEISFQVRDHSIARAKILEDATLSARRNAEAIAAAADCQLGKVLRIEYGWSEIRFQTRGWSIQEADVVHRQIAAPDFEPEDIEGQDSVTMVFELA